MRKIDDVEELKAALKTGEPKRVHFGKGSLLKLDRDLPFLLLHRAPKGQDLGTPQLLTGEAAYLLVAHGDDPRPVLEAVIEEQHPKFGAFLILEVWATEPTGEEPGFVIHAGKNSSEMIESFSADLRRLQWEPEPIVKALQVKPQPEGMPSALSVEFRQRFFCYRVGLGINPIYQDAEGKAYPMTLRSFRRKLALVFRRLFYRFARQSTPLSPPNFQTLGPRALVKRVWQIDQALEDCSLRYSFLLQVTPTNTYSAWLEFKRHHYEREPFFVYRPFPFDPTELKRELFAIPVEKVEDPTLADIFMEKQRQLDTRITMVSRRRTSDFLYGSLSLYGQVDPVLEATALQILERAKGREADSRVVKAEEFVRIAQRHIRRYQKQWDGFTPTVELREDLGANVLCDRGNLLVGNRAEIARSRVEPLLHHEVGTHLVTYYNGRAQPLRQLALGLADYLELQEGLAVLSEFLSGPLSVPRMKLLALRVIAVKAMVDGATFVENFHYLNDRYQVANQRLFEVLTRIYRGGGFTKDAIYLRGLISLLKGLSEGLDLEALFVGKIGRHHLPLVRELQWRHVLKPAPLSPLVLKSRQARERLKKIRQGMSVVDLLDQL